MNIKDAFEGYVLAKRSERVADGTLVQARYAVERFAAYAEGKGLAEVTVDHLRAYMAHLAETPTQRGAPPSGATVQHNYKNLRSFFRWCVDEDLLPTDPTDRLKKPRREKLIAPCLTERQALDLMLGLKKRGPTGARDFALFHLFLSTGLRVAEMASLTKNDVLIEGQVQPTIKVMGKGRKERLIPLLPDTRLELWKYINRHRRPKMDQPHLFLGYTGLGLTVKGMQSLVSDRLLELVGEGLGKHGPHLLRHSFATWYIKRGHDIKRLQLIMGHTDISTTDSYIRTLPTDINHTPAPEDKGLGLLEWLRKYAE